jgi:molybdopterin molybdotransferase
VARATGTEAAPDGRGAGKEHGLISIEEALAVIAAAEPRQQAEEVDLAAALGRVLARTVSSPIDSPPFDKAAMDGFAIPDGDPSSGPWRVRETVQAGSGPAAPVGPGECVRIMTGAMLPAGARRVIRKEFSEEAGGSVRRVHPETGDNVVQRGANLRAGEPVLHPKVLAAQDIGALAASGLARVPAAVPPLVGILCTGNEIRAPGEPLGPGEIYNSSAAQLGAQLAALHCPSRYFGTVPDRRTEVESAIAAALESCGLLLLTGGVSEGDFDYVPSCLESCGAHVLFHGVAIKPGKPTLYARRGGTHILGLPGNPVSTFVVFEILARPLLMRLMGAPWEPFVVRAPLAAAISRRQTERDEFRPVRLAGGAAEPLPYHGSAHLNALGAAQGLIRIARGIASIPAGETVDVRLI